jgi:hypothetical protein
MTELKSERAQTNEIEKHTRWWNVMVNPDRDIKSSLHSHANLGGFPVGYFSTPSRVPTLHL